MMASSIDEQSSFRTKNVYRDHLMMMKNQNMNRTPLYDNNHSQQQQVIVSNHSDNDEFLSSNATTDDEEIQFIMNHSAVANLQKEIIEDSVKELMKEKEEEKIELVQEQQEEVFMTKRSFTTKISVIENTNNNNNNIKDQNQNHAPAATITPSPYDIFYDDDVMTTTSSVATMTTNRSTTFLLSDREQNSSSCNKSYSGLISKSSYTSYNEYKHHRDYHYEQEEDDDGYIYHKSTISSSASPSSASPSPASSTRTTITKITKTKRKSRKTCTLLSPKLLLCRSQRQYDDEYDNNEQQQVEYRQPSLIGRSRNGEELLYQPPQPQKQQRGKHRGRQERQQPSSPLKNNSIEPYPLIEKTTKQHNKTTINNNKSSFVDSVTHMIGDTSSSLLSSFDKMIKPIWHNDNNDTDDKTLPKAYFHDNDNDDSDNTDDDDNIEHKKDIRVTVLVEAAAMCERPSDCQNDDDDDSHGTMVFSSHFVGTVIVPPESSHPDGAKTSKTKTIDNYGRGIRPKTRVASLVPWYHANHPYITVRPKYLMKVPKHFDAADIACLVAFYLPAFQVLHHGQRNMNRFTSLCFYQKKILFIFTSTTTASNNKNTVTNVDDSNGNIKVRGDGFDSKNNIDNGSGIIELIKAMIRLSTYGGCTDIYVIAPKQEHKRLRRVMNHNIIMVDSNQPNKWLSAFDQSMDIVIDCTFPNHFDKVKNTMKPKVGRLVCYPSWGKGFNGQEKKKTPEKSDKNNYIKEWYQLSTMKRSYIYDLKQSIEVNYDDVVVDMKFLLHLLEKRIIRPLVERYHNDSYSTKQEK